MDFVPALSVLDAVDGIIVQQSLAEHRRSSARDCVPQWRQILGVAIFWRRAEVEQSSNSFDIVLLGCTVQSIRSAPRPVVDKRSAAYQGQEQRTGTSRYGRYRQRRLCARKEIKKKKKTLKHFYFAIKKQKRRKRPKRKRRRLSFYCLTINKRFKSMSSGDCCLAV